MIRLLIFSLIIFVFQSLPANAIFCIGTNIFTGKQQEALEREGVSHFWAYADWDPTGRPRITYNPVAFALLPDYMRKFTEEHECCHHKIYNKTKLLNAMMDEVEASCCVFRTHRFNKSEVKNIGNYFEKLGVLPPDYYGSGASYWSHIVERCPDVADVRVLQAEIEGFQKRRKSFKQPERKQIPPFSKEIVLIEHIAFWPRRYALFQQDHKEGGWTPTGRSYCVHAAMVPGGKLFFEVRADRPRRYGIWRAERLEDEWEKTGTMAIAPPFADIALFEVTASNPKRYAFFEKNRKEIGWHPTGRQFNTIRCGSTRR